MGRQRRRIMKTSTHAFEKESLLCLSGSARTSAKQPSSATETTTTPSRLHVAPVTTSTIHRQTIYDYPSLKQWCTTTAPRQLNQSSTVQKIKNHYRFKGGRAMGNRERAEFKSRGHGEEFV